MNELPYFYFIVLGQPPKWPYYAEIPYTAWPDEAMYYNSNGNCTHVYDRTWSYLDVMNWDTNENILICNAKMFDAEVAEKTRMFAEQNLGWGDDLLASTHIARLFLYLLENLPVEYRKEGNAIVSSFRCSSPTLSAAVSDLFVRRLESSKIWDAQSGQIIDPSFLRANYLTEFPIETSVKIGDEVQLLFSKAETKYQGPIEENPDWWKTISQVRKYLEE